MVKLSFPGFLSFLLVAPSYIVIAEAQNSQELLRVTTLNFACRDLYPLAACDNCQRRFDRIAAGILDEDMVEGLPDLEQVDVVLAQELGTDTANFQQISDALKQRGFRYVSREGEPAPTASDPICRNPILYHRNNLETAADWTGLKSGGLVTWSRYPILGEHAQNWCHHIFPTPSGYLVTLLDVGEGRVAAVVNLHMVPEINVPVLLDIVSTKDLRTFQFGEISTFVDNLKTSFEESGVVFSIILGGDFNEDLYQGRSQVSSTASCGLLDSDDTQLMKHKFSSLNLDVMTSCQNGMIGTPTWDPTHNDIALKVSFSAQQQVLDYLFQHSSSVGSTETPLNEVSTLKSTQAWEGQFCKDTNLGEAGGSNNLYTADAFALSDHSMVTASFEQPSSTVGDTLYPKDPFFVFDAVVTSWNMEDFVDKAACGQQGTVCRTDGDCCSSDYSWNTKSQQCEAFECSPCASLGQGCGAQIEGSECCAYHDYSSGQGAHCEMDGWVSTTATCVLKFQKGETCLWDEECQSKNCSFTWRGKKCE